MRVAKHEPERKRERLTTKHCRNYLTVTLLLKLFVGQYCHVTVSCYRENMSLKRKRKFVLEKPRRILRNLKLKKQVSGTLTATLFS